MSAVGRKVAPGRSRPGGGRGGDGRGGGVRGVAARGQVAGGRSVYSREALSELQRTRLLTALVETVAEVGYSGLTVEQVVRRARVSRKTFYELFEDREDCFLVALEHALDRVSGDVVEAYEREPDWRSRVRAGLLAILSTFDREPRLAQLCVVQSLHAGPRVQQRRAQLLGVFAGVLDEGRLEKAGDRRCSKLTAEGLVGAVTAVVHARSSERSAASLAGLLNELMSMIVLPYLGPAEARKELERAVPKRRISAPAKPVEDPLAGLKTRVTYRTIRALEAIAATPGMNNREIAQAAGVLDQGQASKLLGRLESLGLVQNANRGHHIKGAPNAWGLTTRGRQVQQAIGEPPLSPR